MGSELIFRGHESQPKSDSYSSKPHKPWLSVIHPIWYELREQLLIFILVGIAIATLFFTVVPGGGNGRTTQITGYSDADLFNPSQQHLMFTCSVVGFVSVGGKIPLGLKPKGLRIVVTGGAGFVGIHLMDRLIARGDSVIVVDNFFTGRKENVMHHFVNPRFELIQHDIMDPLLLEVDQIYHLACPASPIHYKHNPIKTIISIVFLH